MFIGGIGSRVALFFGNVEEAIQDCRRHHELRSEGNASREEGPKRSGCLTIKPVGSIIERDGHSGWLSKPLGIVI